MEPEDGGRWTSLRVDAFDLLTAVELPGAHPPVTRGCFVMAPFAGRLGYGRLPWNGTVHELPLHAPPHAIHGTAVDAPWDVLDATATTAVLEHRLRPPWPFSGTVRQELALAPGRLETRLVLHATEAMPAVLGWHPWFPRQLSGAGVRLDVRPLQQYVRGDDGLPTGRLTRPLAGPHDDCFLGLRAAPRLVWPGALELLLDSPTDHWTVFDEHPDAVCVEPQTGPPDAVRLGRATVVPAGGSLELPMTLRWRRLPGART